MQRQAQSRRVVIVGGGISGLAAAHRLCRLAPDTEVVLVEREARLGGKIVTERVDGFVVEGGPDSFLSSKLRGVGLCRELGLEDRLQGPDPATRRTYVMRDGRLHRMPEGLSGLIPTRMGPLLSSDLISPLGKARAGLDYCLPAASDAAAVTRLNMPACLAARRELHQFLLPTSAPAPAPISAVPSVRVSVNAPPISCADGPKKLPLALNRVFVPSAARLRLVAFQLDVLASMNPPPVRVPNWILEPLVRLVATGVTVSPIVALLKLATRAPFPAKL